MAERNLVTTRDTDFEDDASSDRSAEEIRHDIAAKRESISETVDLLSDRFKSTLDWRTYVGDYPWVAVGVAVGAGLLLSGIFKRRETPYERMMHAVADSFDDLTDRFRDAVGELPTQKSGPGKTIKAAVTATLTKAALDLAKRQVGWGVKPPPQFNGRERYSTETAPNYRSNQGTNY